MKLTEKRKEEIKFVALRTLGNFFILFTIFGCIATFGPALYYEFAFRAGAYSGVTYQVEEPVSTESELGRILDEYGPSQVQQQSGGGQSLLGAVLADEKEQILVPPSSDFSIVIPKIGANESIIPNVDPSDKNAYLNVLKDSVAHAQGSSLPGRNGTTYLFAHSADSFWNVGRYNAVFYLLNKLQVGDEITIFFEGRRYNYVVYDKKIVNPDEVGYIAANEGQGETLILQTCWPPGTTWKRELIFAKPAGF